MNREDKTIFWSIIIVIVLLGFIYILNGCAPKPLCPSEDVVIVSSIGWPVVIPEGFLEDKDNFFTMEEFKEEMRKRSKRTKDKAIRFNLELEGGS